MTGICRDADINSQNGTTYCRLMVSRINLISTVMSCSTFDMSVTCSFQYGKLPNFYAKVTEFLKVNK